MIIQVDTREHAGKNDHILEYLDALGIKWVRSKLIVGDYMNLEKPMIVVDRKKGLQEVASNLTADHERFRRECELAKELGLTLIILVEEERVASLPEVNCWYNYRRRISPKAVSGKQLFKIMSTMREKYGVEWRFATRKNFPSKLIELLETTE